MRWTHQLHTCTKIKGQGSNLEVKSPCHKHNLVASLLQLLNELHSTIENSVSHQQALFRLPDPFSIESHNIFLSLEIWPDTGKFWFCCMLTVWILLLWQRCVNMKDILILSEQDITFLSQIWQLCKAVHIIWNTLRLSVIKNLLSRSCLGL